jgi:hypothetical protein
MNPRRPDYERYIRSLSLPSDATPWEQLARSGGKRTGDTIQLFPEPIVRVDGSSRCYFLVHGVRHIEKNYNPSVQQRIQNLHKGDSLQLVPEPDNVVNPRALLTSTGGGASLDGFPICSSTICTRSESLAPSSYASSTRMARTFPITSDSSHAPKAVYRPVTNHSRVLAGSSCRRW